MTSNFIKIFCVITTTVSVTLCYENVNDDAKVCTNLRVK